MTTYANIGHIQLKRGNSAFSSTYTGPIGEPTFDTDLNTIRVHDGATPGGIVMPTQANAQAYANLALAGSDAYTFINLINANVAAANAAIVTANVYNQNYTNTAIANLINSAPGTLDTLGEIAANLASEAGAVGSILNNISNINTEVAVLQGQVYTNSNVNAFLNTYLPSYSGNLTAGNLYVNGNINYTGVVNSITVNSTTGQFQGNAAGFGALYAGILSGYTYQPQTTLQVSSNFDGYAQINSQNISSGALASSDFIATADNGTASAGYIDMGIASSTYNYPGFGIIKPNDGYLLVTGGTGTGGGNLILTTGTANDIVFAPNNTEAARFKSDGGISFPSGASIDTSLGFVVTATGSTYSTALVAETNGLSAITAHNNSNGDSAYLDVVATNPSIALGIISSGQPSAWVFDSVGFGFPDGSKQTTAYTGYGNANVASYLTANPVTTNRLVNGTYALTLQSSGYLTVPTSQYGTAQMFSSSGVPLYIGTLDSGNYWQFKTSGVFQFPDGTQQTTAYTGYGNTQVASFLVASSQTIGNAQITGTTTFGTALQIVGSTNTITTTNGSAVQFGQRANFNSANGIYVSGNIVAQSGTASTSSLTGAVQVSGGIGVTGNINAGGNIAAPYFAGNVVATNITTSVIKTTPVNYNQLPSASSAGAGARAFILDGNTNTFASAVTGSGIYNIPVFSNGSNWYVG